MKIKENHYDAFGKNINGVFFERTSPMFPIESRLKALRTKLKER
jgi:hypothetical protein